MGRDVGHIALNAGVGSGAEEILVPEEDLGLDRLLESLEKSRHTGKSSSIVVVAEGDKTGKNVFELRDYVDGKFRRLRRSCICFRTHATWRLTFLF